MDIDHCPKCGEYLHDEMGHMCPTQPTLNDLMKPVPCRQHREINCPWCKIDANRYHDM